MLRARFLTYVSFFRLSRYHRANLTTAPSPLYATTKTITVTTTKTTYTYTPVPSPTKPAVNVASPRSPRPKSVSTQPANSVARGRSMESKRPRTIYPNLDVELGLAFPNRSPTLVPSESVPTQTRQTPPAPATPPLLSRSFAPAQSGAPRPKYAFPRPAPFRPPLQQSQPKSPQPPSSASSSSNPLQLPPAGGFARRYTRIVHPNDLAKPKIGINTYYVVMCGQEVGIFYSP